MMMDKRTQAERFDLLEDVLKGLKDDGHRHLFLSAWAARFDPTTRGELGQAHPCGTVACVLGSLALDPRAQELGLWVVTGSTARHVRTPADLEVGEQCWVSYGGKWNFDAGAGFLGLTGDDKYRLFSPAQYVEVIDENGDVPINFVLDRVREVRAGYGV
jgi:hypothetical protein